MENKIKFDIRDYEYFKNKNIFSGSAGDFKYRIMPEGDILMVALWKGEKCFQLSDILEEKEFTLSVEGVDETIAWIKQRYDEIE